MDEQASDRSGDWGQCVEDLQGVGVEDLQTAVPAAGEESLVVGGECQRFGD
jgi:hypothetical protein